MLAGPGGDANLVYAPEFKAQRGRAGVWFWFTFSSPVVNEDDWVNTAFEITQMICDAVIVSRFLL